MTSGWTHAAIFNAMLLLLPMLAANVLAGVFAARDLPHTPRPAALEATRAEIKSQFSRLAGRADERRDHWAKLVDLQLRARNMPAARGFLLAAPQMLDARDREAVEQAAPQAVPFGTADEQLVGAALLFLPNDVRVRFETAQTSPDAAPAGSDAPSGVRVAAASATRPITGAGGFSVLGEFEDLVRMGQDWMAGDTRGLFALQVTALGLLEPALEPPSPVDLREAMSLLKAANRAARLDPRFHRALSEDLEEALPEEALAAALAGALAPGTTIAQKADALETAMPGAVVAENLPALYAHVSQINEIVDATGPVAALAMLQHVQSPADLRRARLVAESGGDRAVALEAVQGRSALQTARTGVDLNREDVLEIMGLAAAAMALFWMVLLSVQKHMRRPLTALDYYD
ncbi:MAG: hypothetical protein AAGH87_00480 [Pseudomonadota bacterium]